jgi:hypothetical protein
MEDQEPYFVHIVDCNGRPLRYCGKTYAFLPAKCGHLEVDVPPGCYSVFAGHTPNPGHGPTFGNRLTHVSVIRVNCGDHACVTLFAPALSHCGTWFAYALNTQLAGLVKANVERKLATAAVEAVNALLAKLPPDEFAQNTLGFLVEGDKEKK